MNDQALQTQAPRRVPLNRGEILPVNFHADGSPALSIKPEVQGAGCHGNAYGYYAIINRNGREIDRFRFQSQPLEHGINGQTNEALIAIVKDRLVGFQAGPTSSPFNELGILGLEIFERAMKARTADRVARGVVGKHQDAKDTPAEEIAAQKSKALDACVVALQTLLDDDVVKEAIARVDARGEAAVLLSKLMYGEEKVDAEPVAVAAEQAEPGNGETRGFADPVDPKTRTDEAPSI